MGFHLSVPPVATVVVLMTLVVVVFFLYRYKSFARGVVSSVAVRGDSFLTDSSAVRVVVGLAAITLVVSIGDPLNDVVVGMISWISGGVADQYPGYDPPRRISIGGRIAQVAVLFFAGLVAALRLVVVSDRFGIEDNRLSVVLIATALFSLSISGAFAGLTILNIAPEGAFVVAVGGLAFAFAASLIVGFFVGVTVFAPFSNPADGVEQSDPVRSPDTSVDPTRMVTTPAKSCSNSSETVATNDSDSAASDVSEASAADDSGPPTSETSTDDDDGSGTAPQTGDKNV